MNQMQNYPKVIESSAYILLIFFVIFLLSVNLLIYYRILSTPKQLRYVTLFSHNAIQRVSFDLYSLDLLHMLIFYFSKLFLG